MNIQAIRDNCKMKYQQGDVIIRLVQETLDLSAKEKLNHLVLVPSTNPHVANTGTLYKTTEDSVVLVAESPVKVTHREHGVMKLPAGTYFVEPVVEVDFLNDMIRPVVD